MLKDPPSCYICLEPCETLSPCQCRAVAHTSCLLRYAVTSTTTECSICKTPIRDFDAIGPILAAVAPSVNYDDVMLEVRSYRRIRTKMCMILSTIWMALTLWLYFLASGNTTFDEGGNFQAESFVMFLVLACPIVGIFSATCSLEDEDEDEDEDGVYTVDTDSEEDDDMSSLLDV